MDDYEFRILGRTLPMAPRLRCPGGSAARLLSDGSLERSSRPSSRRGAARHQGFRIGGPEQRGAPPARRSGYNSPCLSPCCARRPLDPCRQPRRGRPPARTSSPLVAALPPPRGPKPPAEFRARAPDAVGPLRRKWRRPQAETPQHGRAQRRPVALDECPELHAGHLKPEFGQEPVGVLRAEGHLCVAPPADDVHPPSIGGAIQRDRRCPDRPNPFAVIHRILLTPPLCAALRLRRPSRGNR